MPRKDWLSGKPNSVARSATNVTSAAILTKNVSVYSMTVIPPLILTAQPPNSSSESPLPPLPSVIHVITCRYIAETMMTVKTTIQTVAPNVICATPATTINFKKGPKT